MSIHPSLLKLAHKFLAAFVAASLSISDDHDDDDDDDNDDVHYPI